MAWQDIEADVFDQDTAAIAFAKTHRIRQRARELCVMDTANTKIRLSQRGRMHKQRQWALGQWVYVWRRYPGTGGGHVTRARWTGPGVVVLQVGHTVYVSMRSRLWKCNSDQLRAASHYESVGAALADTPEMRDILQQSRQGRCGAVDVASEGSPPDGAEDQGVPDFNSRGSVASAATPLPTIPEEREARPSAPLTPVPQTPRLGQGHLLRGIGTGSRGTDTPVTQAPTTPRPRIRAESREEPLAEPAPQDKRRKTSEVSPMISEEGSTPRSDRSRVKRQVTEIERAVEEQESKRLEREALRELKRIEREEKAARRSEASSASASASASAGIQDVPEDTPTPLGDDDLLTHLSFLQLKPSENKTLLVKGMKPKNSEFNMRDATPEDIEGFRKSDASEWQSIVEFGAVRVLDEAESESVRKKEPHRIIASRVVRRKKPMPGIGNFKYKSRWCVLGHGDPDVGTFRTFSPMPCTEAITLFFLLALRLGLSMSFADVKSAFCQRNPLNRPQGPLYAEACAGLGLTSRQLIQLIAPVYGLDDAPIRWHDTVLEFLLQLGFERSLFEPCWLVKRINGKIEAMILLEVDDFNIAATKEYQPILQQLLTERFVFGKWERDSADFAGRTVTFLEDRVVMSQEKYIVEKLHQIKVSRGMLSNKKAYLTPDQFEEYRSMLYRVSWLAHQTRPEAAGIVSLLSSRLNKATIHDLSCLNKLIHHIKSTASQPLVLHKFDLDKLILIAASDAGGVAGNPIAEEAGSEELEDTVQGAWVILAANRMPSASQKTKVSVLSWRSSKLKRRVSSTLAGEALSFSQALSEVEWIQLMIRDVLHGDVHREDWRKSIVPFVAVLKEDCQLKTRLDQCCVTDAKSLFDAITKESTGSRQDRRTAIEIAIILDAIKKSKSTVRWSPHPRMIADVLTKDNIAKSNGALEELLRTSKLSLWEEEEELQKRREDPSFKLRSKKASERMRSDGNFMLSIAGLANKKFGELIECFHHTWFAEDSLAKHIDIHAHVMLCS